MNLIYPALCDGLVAVLKVWPDLAGVSVLDGPSTEYAGNEGIAVGASREDIAGEFAVNASDMSSDGSGTHSLTSTVWVRTGDTTFSAARTRCGQLYTAAAAGLASDRTLKGAVSTAWVVGGSFDQMQTGSGVLVFVEFRIEATVF